MKSRFHPQGGEWLTTNNRRVFGVNVVSPDPCASFTWKAHRASGITCADAVESEGHIKVEGRYPTKDYPKSLEEMLKYDVIINSDIKKEVFTDQQLLDTVRWVEEYGGGFAMVGGFSAFGSGGYQKTVIDKLIPVSMEHYSDVKWESFKPAFPPGALDHAIMQIGETAAENDVIWKQNFPLLYGYNYVDHAKPGAVVLAQHPTEQNQFGPMVILAVQEVGKGRTMAFTSDTTVGWVADFETLWGEPLRSGDASFEEQLRLAILPTVLAQCRSAGLPQATSRATSQRCFAAVEPKPIAIRMTQSQRRSNFAFARGCKSAKEHNGITDGHG